MTRLSDGLTAWFGSRQSSYSTFKGFLTALMALMGRLAPQKPGGECPWRRIVVFILFFLKISHQSHQSRQKVICRKGFWADGLKTKPSKLSIPMPGRAPLAAGGPR
jgi:hypothetical protein